MSARPSKGFCEVSRKLQLHQFHKLYNDNCFCFFLSMTHLLHLSWMLDHQSFKTDVHSTVTIIFNELLREDVIATSKSTTGIISVGL